MDDKSRFIAKRAFIAAGLTAGFYLLALGIIAVLLFIPYAEWRFADRIHFNLVILCLGAAGAIFAALIPPRDDFKVAGLQLSPEDQPRLFAEVESIAAAMSQAPPAELYLVPEVNAWVTERGGSRIMGLGLPLLAVLDLSHLHAVLAHEFGHYYAGDTRLGPWLYRTRMTIGRTIQGLEKRGHNALQVPFKKYGALFLRVTQGVSRLQELRADELSARYAGPQVMAESLRNIHSGGMAFSLYWENEVVPLLEEGYVPPVLAGFSAYVKLPHVEELVSRWVDERLKDSEEDIFDSHPPLKQRLEAIENVKNVVVEHRQEPAVSLLDDVEDLEYEMISEIAHAFGGPEELNPIAWHEAGQVAFLPRWRKTTAAGAGLLEDVFPENLGEIVKSPEDFFRKLSEMAGGEPSKEEIERQAAYIVGASLAVALAEKGWLIRNELGSRVRMEKDGESLDLFGVVHDLTSGEITDEAWKKFCARSGIAGVSLGSVAHNALQEPSDDSASVQR